ncbi:hypothetical protein [Chryseobacterium sp. CFS15]|uniref:hypothetical protein n=1 Tax=Chryseobacterium sp. CFS15 TaxID=2986946 RepID=UPI002806E4F5|nr:hypothetical protein [Chryseobacterium sp. CFS15]MDQ8140840.1 hypothetical protein [Chryseobacterium sp. CFS15]
MKKINFLMFFALVSLLSQCRTEFDSTTDNSLLNTTLKPDSTGMYRMEDVPIFKNYLKKNSPDTYLKNDNNTGIYENNRLVDVINKNERVSYSTLVKKENNVYQIWVYTVGKNESFFIAEYVSSVSFEYFELAKFTGIVEYKAMDGELLGTENFENGRPVKNVLNKAVCGAITTPISCIEGLHFGNEPCAWAGTSSAAYYETEIIRCKNYQNTIYNDGGAGYGSSGGGTNPAYHLPAPQALNYMLAQIGMPSLNSQQFSYVKNNIPIAERLRTFFFTDQTVNGSNFLYWGIDFLRQNPSVTWPLFENWFIINPILNNTLQNELFEDWADPNRVKPTSRFKNHTKLNGIYNKIKTAANFKQYLENFEPTFSVAHLMFDLDATQNPNALAETNPPSNYWIKIIFNKNKDWENTPKAVIADTFMHEMIHAEIYRKLISLASTNGNIDVNKITADLLQHNYPGLFDYYVRFTKGDADAQHQLMAAHYVNIMVNFLKQVYGSQYTDIEYRTIVWMGMQDTKAWNLLPEVDRKLYIKTWNENYWSWEK